ncbi:MAG: T9SS type A sorting domain-containing protein [Flavobacteriales bacterium]
MKHSTMFMGDGVCSPNALVSNTATFLKAFLLSLLFVVCGALATSAQSTLTANGPVEQIVPTQDDDDDDDDDEDNLGCGPFKIRWFGFVGASSPNEAHDIGPKNHQGYIGTAPNCLLGGNKTFWTGGYYGGTPQQVSGGKLIYVPVNASTLNFEYNAYFGNNETDGEHSFIKINGNEEYTVSMSNDDVTVGYVDASVDLSAYAGQIVLLTLGNTAPIGGDIGNVFFGCFHFGCAVDEPCDAVLSVTCPQDATLECGVDYDNLELAGAPSFEGSVLCEMVIEAGYQDIVSNQGDCGFTITRVWSITLGDLTETCTQIITVVDTQGPVFPELNVINVQCLEEVEGPMAVIANDACHGEISADSFTSQTGEKNEECILSTAFGPGADWAVWLPVLASDNETSSANFVFDVNGGQFDQFVDGTAHLYGTVVNTANNNEQLIVDLWFENKADWATWNGLGRNYKNDLLLGCAVADHINWEYFELVGGFSTLTGAGDLAGDVLYLYHMPSSYYFGFQKGIGANNKNCNSGLSGWFSYDGWVNGESVEGHGDVNVDTECEPVNDGECVHSTSFTHFYRAEDACGHASFASYDVVVLDTTPPTFDNCPQSVTIECDQDIPALELNVTATDNCVGDVMVTYNGEVVVGNSCHTIIRRTWTAVDVCGNVAECEQQIDVVDTTAPVMTGLPEEEITVECDAVPNAPEVTATDNCQGAIEPTYYESIYEGNCPHNYTIHRYWSADDGCGNVANFHQTIHVQDTTAPVFDDYEFYAHIECDEIPALITATDNCGEATVVVTHEVLNSGGCLGVYYRIYTATDECGNSATAEQYIAIQDLTAPELVGIPAETTLECDQVSVGEDGNYFGIDGVYGIDNCEMEVTVTYTEEAVSTDDNCPASFDIIRTWTGIDYCENDTTVSVVFHVVDTTAPELWIPSDYTAECDEELYYGEPSASDNCSEYSISEVRDTLEGNCPQNYQITRTFVATDACGNASEPQTQTITVQDTQAPVFGDDDIAYYTFECDEEIVTENPDATDNCGEVSYYHWDTEHSFDGLCYEFYYHVTVATDECGNSNEFWQLIVIVDTTAPVITGEIEVEIPCEEFEIESGIFITAEDNCNEFDIRIDSTQLVSGECAGVYLRYYTAYDVCGNESNFEQIIRLLDEIAPVGNEPQDIEVLCSNEIPAFDPEFTDNCGGEVWVEYTGFEVTDICNVTYTEYWTATDACGNTATIDRNVTIYDNVDPWFYNFPADMEVSCDDELPAIVYPIASDNCDSDVEIEFEPTEMPGDCPQEKTIYRTFRGYDDCGNQVVQTQTIHVYDNEAPIFEEQAWAYEYECDQDAELIQPVASDNCGEVTYTHLDTNYYAVECFEAFYRVWTATDECGNSSNFYQYIYFIDTTAPVITGELEVEVPCEEFEIDGGIFVEATDNCNEFVIVIDSTQLVSGECAGVYLRYYTAYDICQNASEQFLQIIHLTDETAPVGNEPADITISCTQGVPAFDPMFTDNCGGEVWVDYAGFEITDICNASYTETWTATDACGNVAVIDRVVTVVDNNLPYVYAPQDYTAECDEELYLGEAWAWDSCDYDVNISVLNDTIETDCASNYSIVRTFTATDDCGNEATAVQTITVEDTQAPVFDEYVNYYEFECDEDFITEIPTATDACSDVTYETEESEYSYDGPCFFFFTRTTTATDCAGNSAEAVVTIIVRDTTAPVITGEIEVEVPCEEFEIDGGIFVEATDNCNEFVIVIDSTQLVSGECAGVYLRYYTAYDICQNQSESFEQIIRLIDETAPVGNEPADITISCTQGVPAFDPAFTDNCGGEVEVVYVGFEITDICNASYTETWTAYDGCGNVAMIDRVVTVVDNNNPVIYAPEDVVAECDELYYLGSPYAYDSCDWNVDITSLIDTTYGDCPANYVVTITYTATDDCGNSASDVQTITIQDTTNPYFTFVPQGGMSTCDEWNGGELAIADDNCSNVEVTHVDEETPFYEEIIDEEGDCNYLTYSVGGWGNENSPQAAYADANFAGAFPANLVVGCGGNTYTFTSANAVQAFLPAGGPSSVLSGAAVNPTSISNQLASQLVAAKMALGFDVFDAAYSPSNGSLADVTFNSGAFSGMTIAQVVALADAHLGGCANTYTLGALADALAQFNLNFDAGDNNGNFDCGGGTTIICGIEITRTFTATDACGNQAIATVTYVVYDNEAPTFDQELIDVYVECESEIPAIVEVTATDLCSEVTVTSDADQLEVDECGNQVILVSYVATDACGNEARAFYYIYVNDVTAPVIEDCPADLVLGCDDEVPAAEVLTATDNCGGSWEVEAEEYIMGEMPEEGSIADCDLITPQAPEANCFPHPYDWAMVMFNQPLAHRYFQVAEGEIVRFPDGSAHVVATMVNAANPANGFMVDVWFANEKDWADWSTQSFPTSFKADCDGIAENHEEWLYFILQAGSGAELTGFGAYTGSAINLTHAPANNYFGFQLGDGANNLTSGYGFGGWFSYSGTWVNGESTTSISGAGDFAFELDCCPDYYIVRQWTATDCTGNTSETCMQYITFEGNEVQGPQINDNPADVVEGRDLSISVMPNPAENNTIFTFKSTSEGRATLEVFDMAGAKVADIYNNNMEAGLTYAVDFNVKSLATGIYMFRLTQNGNTQMGRLVIN